MQSAGAINGAGLSQLIAAPASTVGAQASMDGAFRESMQALNMPVGTLIASTVPVKLPVVFQESAQKPVADVTAAENLNLSVDANQELTAVPVLPTSLTTRVDVVQEAAADVILAKAPKMEADGTQPPATGLISAKTLKAPADSGQGAAVDVVSTKTLKMPAENTQETAGHAILAKASKSQVEGVQKTAGDVYPLKTLKMSTNGTQQPVVVLDSAKHTEELADSAQEPAAAIIAVKSSEVPVIETKAPSKVVSDGREPDAKATPVVEASDSDTSVKVAVKAHEELHTKGFQDTGAVVVAKKSLRKEDASASDAQIVPVSAEAGATVQQPGQPLPVATTPIVMTAERNDDAASIQADTEAVGEIGSVKGLKLSAPVASKTPARETKKADSIAASVTPQEKVEATVPTAAPVQAHANTANSMAREESSATIAGVVPVHATHATATSAVAGKIADTTGVASTTVNATSQGNNDAKTLIATPNVLEVGIASGSHGWLRVRAELGQMGEVTASVAAASAGAAEGLHKELPAISAYLAEEQVGVNSLVVHAPGQAAGTQDSTLTSGTGTQTGTDAGSGRRDQDTPYGKAVDQSKGEALLGSGSGLNFDFDGTKLPVAVYANGSGSWLSVRV